MTAYLDWNASAPLLPQARSAMIDALGRAGNPSSVHGPGRAARRLVEDARAAVAALAGRIPEHVIFTSGASEANRTVLMGAGLPRRIVSAIEHDSGRHADAEILPVRPDGAVDLDALETLLAQGPPALVSIMAANNETGVIQPIAAAALRVRAHGGRLLVDAAQAAGRIALSPIALFADYVTLSAHKLGGPQGVGAIIADPALPLAPLITGGGQELGRRAGSHNVAGIAGFGAAAAADRIAEFAALAPLRDALETRLTAAGAVIHGRDAQRLPQTILAGLPGLTAETQVMALDIAGYAISSGAACSSGKVRPSPVLAAMGCDTATANEAVRISFGPEAADALDGFARAYEAMAARRRAR